MITDIVYDVCCVVDVLAKRPQAMVVTACIDRARTLGLREWLPTVTTLTLDCVLTVELRRSRGLTTTEATRQARLLLSEFAAPCQWLAALAGDGPLWHETNPEGAQIIHGLARLGPGARLLTRDRDLLERCPQAITPESFLEKATVATPVAFIDLAAQQDRLRGSIEDRIHRVLHHGHYIMGPEIVELEAKLATYVGVKHCITCASGTDTLEIAMRALGIGPGDEVITTPFTWISTAETIAQVGAKPVFVDIEPAYFNINVDLIETAITPRTKAIMPVSLFGQMPDYDRINAIAAKHGLPVIEDGAQSFGATQRGRRSCGVTTIGSTSFFPAKPLGCYGDGGALFTLDDALAGRMRAIRTHGGERRHHHPYIGMNGRLDTLQAAIVLAKLESWDWEVEQRGLIGARYTELLLSHGASETRCTTTSEPATSSVPPCLRGVTPPAVAPGNTHVYAQYTIRSAERDAMAERLKASGIPTAVYYPKCLHEQPCFAACGYSSGSFPESERASREVLSLPMHPLLSRNEQIRVSDAAIGAGIK